MEDCLVQTLSYIYLCRRSKLLLPLLLLVVDPGCSGTVAASWWSMQSPFRGQDVRRWELSIFLVSLLRCSTYFQFTKRKVFYQREQASVRLSARRLLHPSTHSSIRPSVRQPIYLSINPSLHPPNPQFANQFAFSSGMATHDQL